MEEGRGIDLALLIALGAVVKFPKGSNAGRFLRFMI